MNILSNIKNNYEINIYNNCIHIINYNKIVDISYFNIVVSFNDKNISFIGEKLLINKLDDKELIITGIFKGIEFIEK